MTVDTTVGCNGSSPEVMASVETTSHDTTLVIADITCDDAWLSMGEDDAPSLSDWR
jgi:hypothetical protein